MDRRSFFQTAVTSTVAMASNVKQLNEFAIDYKELNAKVDACMLGSTEAINKMKIHSREMMKRFASDLRQINDRMDRIEAQQYLLVFWLALLSLLTGVDFLSPIGIPTPIS